MMQNERSLGIYVVLYSIFIGIAASIPMAIFTGDIPFSFIGCVTMIGTIGGGLMEIVAT